jgi:2-phosphoglycerate kinase
MIFSNKQSSSLYNKSLRVLLSINKYVKEKEEKLSLIVQKRDGNTEPFDQEKMARAVSRAGTPFAMALDTSKTIRNNKDLIQKNKVSSDELRQLVTQELRNRNESTIAESYSGIVKTRLQQTYGKK